MSRFKGLSSVFNVAGLVVAWLIVFGFFSYKKPATFPTLDNLGLLARQMTTVSLAALGMTLIIVSGGIDLSVGSVVAFVTVAIAATLKAGNDPNVPILFGVLVGASAAPAAAFLAARLLKVNDNRRMSALCGIGSGVVVGAAVELITHTSITNAAIAAVVAGLIATVGFSIYNRDTEGIPQAIIVALPAIVAGLLVGFLFNGIGASAIASGHGPWIALFIGLFAGLGSGLLNGLLVTRLKVGPFIVTLGTMLVIRGMAKAVANEQKIDAPINWLSDLLERLGPNEKWRLVPIGVWLTIVLAVLVSLLMRRTRFGRHVVAVGSNEAAARLCGVPVSRVRLAVYVLAGLFVGLAGLMQFSRLTVGDPTAANGLELDVIAAVVIGGASLAGGQGSIVGSLLGAFIMTTISAGCAQMGFPNWVQQIVTGWIIIGAVALDKLRVKAAS